MNGNPHAKIRFSVARNLGATEIYNRPIKDTGQAVMDFEERMGPT